MKFVRRLDARIVGAVPAQPQDPRRVLLVRRERVKEAVAIHDASAELREAHLLSELLAARLVLDQEMHMPRHYPLQGRQAIG